jgi:KDO2-lipid IV(A) lauroyltransferase
MPGRRRVALENLDCTDLGQELDMAARNELVRRSFGHSLALGLDVMTLPRVARDPERYCEISDESVELLREADERGKGVLLVASHFGLMESMGIRLGQVLAERGQKLSFVAKPFRNPHLDAAVQRRRGATGNQTIHKGGAKASMLGVLARGEHAAIVLDQHVSPRARLWVPFFGLPAATARTLGTVAVRTGAPVLLIHSFPLPGGRCRVEVGPLIEAPDTGDADADAVALVEAVVAAQEAAVRRDPPAWNWIHRRWKVHPDEGRQGYPSYAIAESEEKRLHDERVAARREARRRGR